MQLVACETCHTQYDVSLVIAPAFACRCGETIENKVPQSVDALVHRCSACGAQVGADAERCEFCGSEIVREFGPASLICPECFARNSEAARFCAACGVGFRPEPVTVQGEELPCPDCSALMPSVPLAGIGVNECAQCRGLWVPGDHFDALVRRAAEARGGQAPSAPRVRGANPSQQVVRYRKCPVCDAFMHRRNFEKSSGVIIDVCSPHGTWLDADELEQIAGFILSGGRPSPTLIREAEDATSQAAALAVARMQLDRRAAVRRPRQEPGSLLSLLFEIFD